ncbi:MAG: F0F1 ATP synthase subunit A [Chloroflexi bacterium]|nr:F0F1 ATP synthase subunit A [Chloroflexota bacterium]
MSHHEQQPAINPAAARGCMYLLLFLVIFGGGIGIAMGLLPALGIGIGVPVITVFGEPLAKGELYIPFPDFLGGDWDITNTFLALLVADVIVILIALSLRNPQRVPGRFQMAFELMTGYLYNQTKSILGAADAKKVFPLIATFFLLVLVANFTKLVPGYETVGVLHCAEDEETVTMSGYPIQNEDGPAGAIELLRIEEPLDSGTTATEEGYHACKYKYFEDEGEDGKYKKDYEELHEAGEDDLINNLVVAPFFRGATTDLNFTLALALIAMFAVQYYGVQHLGLGYFAKFINLPAVGNAGKNPMGVMDFIVGLLEILSEISKIISFAFRLFGVMFAGGILLIVVMFLTGAFIPGAIYALELFIGLIQAYVFFILPLVLIKLATISHHGDDH